MQPCVTFNWTAMSWIPRQQAEAMHIGTLYSVVSILQLSDCSFACPTRQYLQMVQTAVCSEHSAACSHLQDKLCKVNPHRHQPPVGPADAAREWGQQKLHPLPA